MKDNLKMIGLADLESMSILMVQFMKVNIMTTKLMVVENLSIKMEVPTKVY